MVDPEVFKSVKYDHKIYKGFAFGLGISFLLTSIELIITTNPSDWFLCRKRSL